MSTVASSQIWGWNTLTYLPTGFDKTKPTPCLLFFPGAGEIGTNAALLTVHGPFLYLKSGVDLGLNLIVIAVQNSDQNPRPSELQQIITAIKALYNVSTFIGTGLSRGGQDWAWFANNAESQLAELSGMVLFSSEGTVTDENGIPGTFTPALYLKHNVSYWLGIGTQDPFYDHNKAEYTALTAIAPKLAIWTEWAGAGHGDPVWSDGYNPAWTNNVIKMSIYQWAVSISGVQAIPAPPPVVIPPPVVTPPAAKTIKSILVTYSDGTTTSLP